MDRRTALRALSVFPAAAAAGTAAAAELGPRTGSALYRKALDISIGRAARYVSALHPEIMKRPAALRPKDPAVLERECAFIGHEIMDETDRLMRPFKRLYKWS